VLDIGCGDGSLSFDLANSSWAVVAGVDVNMRSLEKGRRRYQHRNFGFIEGDVSITLPHEPFRCNCTFECP